jgi:hypothetical protein
VDQLLRGLRYHPEQYAPRTAEVDRLADAKRRWIETVPPRGLRLRRHLEIELVNQRLQPLVAAKREELLARRRQLEAALRTKSLSASREYSFCLFPQETLPALLLELSQAEA